MYPLSTAPLLIIIPQTREKLKEAYAAEFAATIERAEKQIILARHGRRLLNLLDDTPIIPGDMRPVFEYGAQARQVLNDAEDDLREWQPELEDVTSARDQIDSSLMPIGATHSPTNATSGASRQQEAFVGGAGNGAGEGSHLATHEHEVEASRDASGASATAGPTYATSEAETSQVV